MKRRFGWLVTAFWMLVLVGAVIGFGIAFARLVDLLAVRCVGVP